MNYAYLLLCADGSLYAGWTNDLRRRLHAHNEGNGAKYTRSRRPVRLVYAESFDTKEEAQKRECQIKKMRRIQRLALIQSGMEHEALTALLEDINKKNNKGEYYFMTEKKVMLTEDGYNKLVEKLDYLKSVRRIEVAERLKAAIALGDLSENSEYDDAKNEQAFLEGEIQELETKIRNSDIIKAGDGKSVTMGSRVKVKDLEFDEEETFLIVGSTEADPDEGKISNESPLGMALLGQKINRVIKVNAPAGIIQYKIIDIKK